MSTEWGGLIEDWTHLRDGQDDQGDEEVVEEVEAGRWQEEIDYSIYADSSMTLPGQGEEGPNCQIWKPAEFCDNCGNVGYAQNHCGRRECPHCSGVWSDERAVGATKRLSAARYAEPDGKERRVVHSTVSPPEGEIRTLQQVYDGFGEAFDLAEEAGVRGAVVIFHGYRVTEEAMEEYRAADPDMGRWRWLKEERPESWREMTYWSPHYHIIGLCEDFEENDPDDQDEWVVVRIDRQGGRSAFLPYEGLRDMDSYEEVFGTIKYLLSHATFEAGTTRDCVRWFGELSTRKFRPTEELSEKDLETIDEKVREVAAAGVGDAEGAEGDEEEECEDCGAHSWSPIWDAGSSLADPAWCDSLDREKEKRLVAAFEWAIGERVPPPGMRYPQTEEQAREALNALL